MRQTTESETLLSLRTRSIVRDMTELDPDLPPIDDALAAAFTLPAGTDNHWVELHEEIVTRMRNESRAVPMGTVQHLLLSNIAWFFVSMKMRADEGMPLKEQKEMMDAWLKMTIEFNRLLTASQDKARTTILVEVQNVLRQGLKIVKDPVEKQTFSQYLNEEFARLDI
jgi:hypothetical protein